MSLLASKISWIQLSAGFVFLLFAGLMVIVTAVAYSKRSGNTGLDMSKVQQLRYEAVYSEQSDEKNN